MTTSLAQLAIPHLTCCVLLNFIRSPKFYTSPSLQSSPARLSEPPFLDPNALFDDFAAQGLVDDEYMDWESHQPPVRATYGVRTPITLTTPVEVRGVRRLIGKSSVITLYNYTTITYLIGKSSENTLRSLQGNLPIIYILVYIVASLVVTHYPAIHCSGCHVARADGIRSSRGVGVGETTCWCY
jgi:hypothetical protein